MLRCCYARCLWYPAEPKPKYMEHTLLKKSRQQFITFVITLHSEAVIIMDVFEKKECFLCNNTFSHFMLTVIMIRKKESRVKFPNIQEGGQSLLKTVNFK